MIAALALVLAAGPSGTATVPLEELVSLLSPEAEVKAETKVAAVTSLKLSGRPGEAGLWVDIEASIRVVSGSAVEVPLFVLGRDTVVETLPDTVGAVAVVRDGTLIALCNSAGSYHLTTRLLVRASQEGRSARVRFVASAVVPPSPMKLDFDDAAFEVTGTTTVPEWGGQVVFPEAGAYQVRWTPKQERTRQAVSQRPPVDLRVKDASSRWVTTLEGRATHELKLALQVDRLSTLSVEVPSGQKLVRARVNGQPLMLEAASTTVELQVAPSALGAAEATVELSFTQEFGVFHLSGALELVGPRVSWPVAKWSTEAVLPSVFTWLRRGGSMEQMGLETAASGEVPGKAVFFSQHLVAASGPTVALGYSVDLKGSYFR